MLRDQLKQCRKEKEITQEELAREIGVLTEQIRQWEKGLAFPTSTQLFQLANFFQTTATDLLDEGDDIYLTADIESELLRLEEFSKNYHNNKKKGGILLLALILLSLLFQLIVMVALWSTFYNTDRTYIPESQTTESQAPDSETTESQAPDSE